VRRFLQSGLPGTLAYAMLLVATCLWIFWGTAEMFHEGWWGPWSVRLPYLVPGGVCFALLALAAARPRAGGWVLIAVGGSFTAWWWFRSIKAGTGPVALLTMLPVSVFVALSGVLLLFEAGRRRGGRVGRAPTATTWWLRNRLYVIVLGVPLLVMAATVAYWLPLVNARLDDGFRGEVLIEGNGVSLVWAPSGPGWSDGWKPGVAEETASFDNPSWEQLALYGLPPRGLGPKPGHENVPATADEMAEYGMFRYLSADGSTLMDEPQDIWRMPTVDEIVRSLVLGGECAGCTWGGGTSYASCPTKPDKETPLWAPDRSPIYYWAADEYDDSEAYYVGYQGVVAHQAKSWGNPRHGYRFIREP